MNPTLQFQNPEAWLLAAGHKSIAVLGKPTRYRGPLAIAAEPASRSAAIAPNWRVAELLAAAGYRSMLQLPAKGIVAAAELCDCQRIPNRREAPEWFQSLPADELTLNDLVPGSYAWRFKLVTRYDPPRPLDPPPPKTEALPAINTQTAALASIGPEESRLRTIVFDDIDRQGMHGATCDEVQRRTGLRMSTVSARIAELKKAAAVIETGRTRETSAGRPAAVLVTLKNANRAIREPSQPSLFEG